MATKRKRYRYITSGVAVGSDPINHYRLVAGNNLGSRFPNDAILRVFIPDDLVLSKDPSESYSTTMDPRIIEELGYDVLQWNADKDRWIVQNQHKGIQLCDIPY